MHPEGSAPFPLAAQLRRLLRLSLMVIPNSSYFLLPPSFCGVKADFFVHFLNRWTSRFITQNLVQR